MASADIPPIPYSESQLAMARRHGEMLVLRVGKDRAGKPLTMKRIHEIGQPRMGFDEGKMLYDTAWYKDEAFYKDAALQTEWALVGKNFVPDSTGKDYIEQTRVLRDHLKKIGGLTDDEFKECSDDILDRIRKLVDSDRTAASGQLAELMVNKNHRRSPAEALYEWTLRLRNKKERTLESTYDWTSGRASDGDLVLFGNAGTMGAYVDGDLPGYSNDSLGVVSVR